MHCVHVKVNDIHIGKAVLEEERAAKLRIVQLNKLINELALVQFKEEGVGILLQPGNVYLVYLEIVFNGGVQVHVFHEGIVILNEGSYG